MRLINTTTLEQQEFFESRLPKYAILSHTWGDHEVSLKRYTEDTEREGPGWEKILNCCRVAKTAGLEWAWCDTCCIDKTSSAELSEAINSMYRWYQQAEVCYAIIEDFENNLGLSALSGCRWFKRGWTLQELLAPRNFQFYDKRWTSFGTRDSLANEVEGITGVDSPILRREVSLSRFSTAQRMFWASSRQTTRPEDAAYCLLGIFDANMPLLYGEGGRKAFDRLQRQILAGPRDDTIYFWHSEGAKFRGMLAESPSEFCSSSGLDRDQLTIITAPIVTDLTVELTVNHIHNILSWLLPGVTRTRSLIVPMACRSSGSQDHSLFVKLRRLRNSDSQPFWIREVVQTDQWGYPDPRQDFVEIAFGNRSARRVKIALHTPAGNFDEHVGSRRDTAGAVVFAIIGFGLECSKAAILAAGIRNSVAPSTVITAGGIQEAIVMDCILLICFWATASRPLPAALGLLLVLSIFGLTNLLLLLTICIFLLGLIPRSIDRWYRTGTFSSAWRSARPGQHS